MARTRRGFKGGTKATTVSGTLSAGALSVPCSDVSTWVGVTTTGPATATISRGETDEETVTFTGISVNTLTGVTRGAAGTTAQEHGSGAKIEHTSSFTDVDEANELVVAMASNTCRVYNSAAISVADNTLQALTFNSEHFDTGGLHSTSVNTGRLTCVTAGKYIITGHVEFESNAVGTRQIAIRLNGSNFVASIVQLPPTGVSEVPHMSITTMYALAAGEYAELVVAQKSGGALNVDSSASYTPEFGMAFVGF